MPRSRTWNLRLNVDDFNSAYASLVEDKDRSQFLTGFFGGVNGAAMGGRGGPLGLGFDLGQSMKEEAESYRERKSEVGKLGGAPTHHKQNVPDGIPKVNQEDTKDVPKVYPIHNPQSLYPENDNPQINTPPSPKGVSSRKKLPRSPSWKMVFPDDVTEATFTIMDLWANTKTDIQPKKCNADPTKYVPESHPRQLADRLWSIQKEDGDLNICVEIAKEYIKDYRAGKTWVKAAENFFGKADDAPFKVYYPAYMTNLKLQEKELESESQTR